MNTVNIKRMVNGRSIDVISDTSGGSPQGAGTEGPMAAWVGQVEAPIRRGGLRQYHPIKVIRRVIRDFRDMIV